MPLTVTLCTGTSFWGWTHPKAETAPPRPNLHQPELDIRFLRTHIGRKGAKASLDTERPRGCLASWEGHVRDHIREETWPAQLRSRQGEREGCCNPTPYPSRGADKKEPGVGAVATG